MLIFSAAISFAQDDINNGKISGYMFGDYFYNIQRDTAISSIPNKALSGEKDLNGFVFRRIYFTYDYDISKSFSTKFRVEADNSTTTPNGKLTIFVKDAFLKWKDVFANQDLIIGIQPTPAFEISESFWGYRSLEKTIMDLRGYVSSRDFGISLRGKLNEKGSLGYWAMYGNNSGVNLENDKYKRYYLHFYVKPIENLTATIYGDLRSQKSVLNPVNLSGTLSRNIYTAAFFLGYKNKTVSFGAETMYQVKENDRQTLTGIENRSGYGISLFGSAKLSGQTAIIGRYDFFEPDDNRMASADRVNYFILGLNYMPAEKVMIIPNLQVETFENKNYKSSVTGRVTFYWAFL